MKSLTNPDEQIVCCWKEFEGLRPPRRERLVNWKTALVVLVILILILAGQPRLTLYSAEEALTVVLGIAVVLLRMPHL